MSYVLFLYSLAPSRRPLLLAGREALNGFGGWTDMENMFLSNKRGSTVRGMLLMDGWINLEKVEYRIQGNATKGVKKVI